MSGRADLELQIAMLQAQYEGLATQIFHLRKLLYDMEPCPHCHGLGRIVTLEGDVEHSWNCDLCLETRDERGLVHKGLVYKLR